MATFSHLVVAVDGSQPARRAVAFACALARSERARLTFCYAVDAASVCVSAIDGGPSWVTSTLATLERDGKAAGAEALAHAASMDVAASSVILHGAAASAVCAYAVQSGADAIVVGTSGRRGLARSVLGSVAAEIVRHAEVPVFTVNPRAELECTGPVTVAVDASPPAAAALRTALSFARSQHAPLELVHVFDDADLGRIPEHVGYDPVIARRDALEATEEQFDEIAARLRAAGTPFTSSIVEGEAVRELVRAATRSHARMIATGTHGRNALGRLLLGSVAERLLCESPVPVMTVRA